MIFETALSKAKSGEKLTRAAWNNSKIFIHTDESLGTISLTRPADPREQTTGTWPWQPGSDDMLADDWQKVE